MKIDKIGLLEKGWKVSEIENASKIIARAEDKKHIGIKWLDKSVYIALLFLMIIANIVFTLILIPFLFAITDKIIVLIVTFIGFVFGVIFSILIADIEKNGQAGKTKLLITLAISGIVNFSLMIVAMIEFSTKSMVPLPHNPYIISGIYLFSFLVPHVVFMVLHRKQ